MMGTAMTRVTVGDGTVFDMEKLYGTMLVVSQLCDSICAECSHSKWHHTDCHCSTSAAKLGRTPKKQL